MNCRRISHIIWHLTSNLLPHYLAKFECSSVQLCSIVIQFKSVTNSLFTENICRNVMFWIKCLCQLIYNIKHVFKISAISTHACFTLCTRHFVNGCVNDALLQCCAKHVAGAVAIYCADMMPNDVVGILLLLLLVFCCKQQVDDSHHLAGGSRRRRTAATVARHLRSSHRW